MAYNKARAEKKWLKWKEAEEKKLRELGVDEETIQRLHTYDWAEFNRERRYLQRQVEWSPYVDLVSAQDLELPVEDVESLMDSIEDMDSPAERYCGLKGEPPWHKKQLQKSRRTPCWVIFESENGNCG